MLEYKEIEPLEDIEEELKGSTSKLDIDTSSLNVAATLASLAIKLLDVTANLYQVHNNVVRLGRNLDVLMESLRLYSTEYSGAISELKSRLSDLEVLQAGSLDEKDEP